MSDLRTLDRTAASQYGVLTHQQLKAAGISRRQIKRNVEAGVLHPTGRGVYRTLGSRPTWHQRIATATLSGSPALAAASVRSSARLWCLRSVDDELEVSISYPRQLRLDGVIVHRSRDLVRGDITWVDGLRTTTPRRTLCDLGLVFPESEVHRMVRHAVATGLVTVAELIEVRERCGRQGRNGVGVLDRCIDRLPAMAAETESGLEVLFLEVCEAYALPMPVPQLPVRAGGRSFRIDFAYPECRLAIEIDGIESHATPEQRAHDARRQELLEQAGWRVVRFTYAELSGDALHRKLRELRRLIGFCDDSEPASRARIVTNHG